MQREIHRVKRYIYKKNEDEIDKVQLLLPVINMTSRVLFLNCKKKGWHNLEIEKILEQRQRKKRKKNYIFDTFPKKVKWKLKITILT